MFQGINKVIWFIFSLAMVGCAWATDKALVLSPEQFESRNGAKLNWDNQILELRIDNPEWSGGVRINPQLGQKFDFSQGRYLACEVENIGHRQMRLTLHISSGKRGSQSSSHVELPHREVNTGIGLNPGEKRTMRIYLPHANLFSAPEGGRHMRVLDTEKINSIEFQMQWPFEHPAKDLVHCRISKLRLEGDPEFDKRITESSSYLPFIDRYGQYIHSEWLEKIHDDEQLVQAHQREVAELDRLPPLEEWDEYGGWKAGPQLEATGSFRVEKYQGKWFLVDPVGHLFWSTGIDVLRNSTDASNRKHPEWYAKEVPAGYELPFNDWNLRKKYGKEDYLADFYLDLVRRLRAWGINTIGNWSSEELISMGRTPYTMCLGEISSPILREIPRIRIEENGKVRQLKIYDVYDPVFTDKLGGLLRVRAEQNEVVRESLTDPMCIGYFIDNELSFGQIVNGTIKAIPDQPAKLEWISNIIMKYDGSIEALNQAWESKFSDWEELRKNNRVVPKGKGFREDAQEFLAGFMERYFATAREAVKGVAPHRLYLGCRLVGFRQNSAILKAATNNCDVISVNTYTNCVANIPASDFQDKPILIGEFHFGCYDRGMFAPGLCPVGDQRERAVSYMRFIQGALVQPNLVGAHYFQLRDQPLTGRWDGEGYQIGFVDVADTPYPELCATAREVGANMYRYRLNGKLVNEMK